MRTTVLALVALVLVSATTAFAQEPRWAASYDEALKEAKERGALILCVLTLSMNEGDCEAQIQAYKDAQVRKACSQFVCLWGDPENAGRRIVMKEIDGKKVRVCTDRGNLPPDVIRGIYEVIVRKFGNLCIDAAGNVRFPLQWVIGPDEKVVEVVANGDKEGGFGVVPPPDLAGRLNAIAKRHGPALSAQQYHKIKTLLAEGDALMKKGDWTAAAAKYREVVGATKKKINAVEEAQAKLDRIATHADSEFTAAEADVAAGRFEEALDRLTDVASKFKGTKAETRANEVLAELAKKPAVKKILASRKDEVKAAKLFVKAEAAAKRKKWKDALKMYRECATKYPKMPSGKKAAAKVAEIEADETIMAGIREAAAAKDCKGWLNLAKNFISNNMPDRAKTYLEKIIATYPGTSWAEKAQKMLADLK